MITPLVREVRQRLAECGIPMGELTPPEITDLRDDVFAPAVGLVLEQASIIARLGTRYRGSTNQRVLVPVPGVSAEIAATLTSPGSSPSTAAASADATPITVVPLEARRLATNPIIAPQSALYQPSDVVLPAIAMLLGNTGGRALDALLWPDVASGIPAVTIDSADGRALIEAAGNLDPRAENPSWVFHPNAVPYLRDAAKTAGDTVLDEELASGRLAGYPIVLADVLDDPDEWAPQSIVAVLGDLRRIAYRIDGLAVDVLREQYIEYGGAVGFRLRASAADAKAAVSSTETVLLAITLGGS